MRWGAAEGPGSDTDAAWQPDSLRLRVLRPGPTRPGDSAPDGAGPRVLLRKGNCDAGLGPGPSAELSSLTSVATRGRDKDKTNFKTKPAPSEKQSSACSMLRSIDVIDASRILYPTMQWHWSSFLCRFQWQLLQKFRLRKDLLP